MRKMADACSIVAVLLLPVLAFMIGDLHGRLDVQAKVLVEIQDAVQCGATTSAEERGEIKQAVDEIRHMLVEQAIDEDESDAVDGGVDYR